jgi:hypothetical protein
LRTQYVRAVRSIQGRISQGHTATAPVTHTDQLVLEWEKGSDIAFVGGGSAMVIAAVAFMLRDAAPRDRHADAGGGQQ